MKKFKAEILGRTIKLIEIVSETDKFYLLKQNNMLGKTMKEAKESQYHKYYDTYEEAKLYLIAHRENLIKQYQAYVDYEKNKLKEINETL
jgi:hypothetical protein